MWLGYIKQQSMLCQKVWWEVIQQKQREGMALGDGEPTGMASWPCKWGGSDKGETEEPWLPPLNWWPRASGISRCQSLKILWAIYRQKNKKPKKERHLQITRNNSHLLWLPLLFSHFMFRGMTRALPPVPIHKWLRGERREHWVLHCQLHYHQDPGELPPPLSHLSQGQAADSPVNL